jgi:hypothetical protein
MGGYFIGTCYDGKTVFKRLQQKLKGEGIAVMKRDRKMYEITKMYDETGFPDDETSLSYMIHVYQDSINKTFPEYLVNFDYLVQMLGNYGFVLLKKEEAVPMGLPNGTGMFSELFSEMESEIEQNQQKSADYRRAATMTEDEKWISFMNRYFVFKKTNNVDAERIYKQFVSKKMLGDLAKQADEVQDALELANKAAKETKKPKIRKLSTKEKVVIGNYSPVLDSAENISPEEIKQIAKSVEAITIPPEHHTLAEEPAKPITEKPTVIFGEPVTIKITKPKITKPKIVIGEPVNIVKKIKKSDKK